MLPTINFIAQEKLKVLIQGLIDKVFNCEKHKHAEEFLKNCEAISKYVIVKFKNVGPEMSIAIKKMEKPDIIILDSLDNSVSRV